MAPSVQLEKGRKVEGGVEGEDPEHFKKMPLRIMLSEIVREKQIPHDFTSMWNLNNKINAENRLIVDRGGGVGGLGKRVEGIWKSGAAVTM